MGVAVSWRLLDVLEQETLQMPKIQLRGNEKLTAEQRELRDLDKTRLLTKSEMGQQIKERRELRRKAAKQRVKDKENQRKQRKADRMLPPSSVSIGRGNGLSLREGRLHNGTPDRRNSVPNIIYFGVNSPDLIEECCQMLGVPKEILGGSYHGNFNH